MIPAPSRTLEPRIRYSEQPKLNPDERGTLIRLRELGALSSSEGVIIDVLGRKRGLALRSLIAKGYASNRSEYYWLSAAGTRRAEEEIRNDAALPVRTDANG